MADAYEFSLDDSHFPVLWVTQPHLFSAEAVDRYCVRMSEIAQRGRFVGVFDTRQTRFLRLGAKERAYFAKASEEWATNYGRGVLLGEAIIVTNSFVKAMVTGFLWLRAEQPFPTAVFSDPASAIEWCAERLRDAGLEVPEHHLLSA